MLDNDQANFLQKHPEKMDALMKMVKKLSMRIRDRRIITMCYILIFFSVSPLLSLNFEPLTLKNQVILYGVEFVVMFGLFLGVQSLRELRKETRTNY